MLKRSFLLKSVILCVAVGLGTIYLLLNPQLVELVLDKPLYGYSIFPFLVSGILVSVIVSRSGFYSPSLFLFLFFMVVPLLGIMSTRQYFDQVGTYFGRRMPSFDFPIFLWSVGTMSFFGGVLLGWLMPHNKRKDLMLWDHKRIMWLLGLSLVLASIGTIVAFYKIGYVPLLKFGSGDVRSEYFTTVGPIATRFSLHWAVPALLSSTLFFLDRSKRRYIYVCILIICAMGSIFYAQRTALVWILSAFGLMYFKFSPPRILRLLAIMGIAFLLIYGMMLQAEHRTGAYASKTENRLVKHGFLEWSQYSIVVNEAQAESKYLGWRILVGPFLTFVPRQIFTLLGVDEEDKGALMMKYSAAYYYGKEFDEPYGIRVTPIGEGFAAYGMFGTILLMMALGMVFGLLERAYFSLDMRDARLSLVCYGLSLTTHMPITTMWVLCVPLTVTGVFVVAYYFYGRTKYRIMEMRENA
jgi:oligosaccharide repeat unit polymerase